MFKLILFALVALGAALYFPSSRAVVLEKAEPVTQPVQAWATRGEMKKIVRDLTSHERTYESLPEVKTFPRWLETKYQGASSTDSWGNEYVFRVWADSFAVVSAGVDGQLGSEDDLTRTEARVHSGRDRGRRR